ncbi:hypothetical protein NLG97_g10088 [Lecanicillium saksenae]|uniref:Uncharacterized protein n=1 Tax=Lecanicillium saksenae TaxID=468837 RepID=A0ACC1QED2_9HYPO|nr:hypothetical protein NLG97_g10088 [Lecanicillium saksenae]
MLVTKYGSEIVESKRAVLVAWHTIVAVLNEESVGPDGDAVFAAMKTVAFNFHGSTRTWHGFYFAFSVVESLLLGVSAFIAWQLDRVPEKAWRSVAAMEWVLIGVNAVQVMLSWMYFFIMPSLLSTAATALLVVGTWHKDRKYELNPGANRAE